MEMSQNEAAERFGSLIEVDNGSHLHLLPVLWIGTIEIAFGGSC